MTTPAAATLVDYVEASATRVPTRTAIVDPGGWSLTYRELDERADRIAGFLVAAGVEAGDRVGVIAPKGANAVIAFLGIMKARAAYVPADHAAPAARNRAILADCAVKVAFLAPSCRGALDQWPADSPLPSAMVSMDADAPASEAPCPAFAWEEAVAHAPARVAGRRSGDLAYILYTSGSTGVPKGVMLTHDNALAFVDWCSSVFAPTEDDRFSSHAPFHFDLSILDVYLPLRHGASVHLISEHAGKSPEALTRFIEEHQLTVWYSTPSILALMTELGHLERRDCRSLRLVLFAGEVFPVKHLRDLSRRWPWAEYYNLYGPTETNVCTFARIPLPIPDDRTAAYPIGWPCTHCSAMVLDDEGGRETRPGQEGLLYISGPSTFSGYWSRPDLDARSFLEREGRRWYNTGDVVSLDEAQGYAYRGRRDRMVKRRGYRIELGEIEQGLYQHGAILEAGVVDAPGGASSRIVAFLSARARERPSIIEMKSFCAARLPSYMSPDVFLFLDAMPRTPTDKIDYQRLARLADASLAALES